MSSDDRGDGYGYQERRGKGWKQREEEADDAPCLLDNLNTYEIRDAEGNLLTTVQGNDQRSVLGIMMLVWGEGIRVTQVNERGSR